MGNAWLDGVQRVPNDHSEGGTYVDGVPWRFVGHTTEVVPSSVAGAVALAGRHEHPPHLWAWPEEDWRCQTVRLDRSAFALLHPAGTPETNKMRAIQVEVIGYAKDSPNKPDEFWDWLGEKIVKPVIDAGYAIDLTNVAPSAGVKYGAWPGRMTRAEWRVFDGVCMHGNVPDNSHWDMGEADLARVAQAAAGGDDVALTEDDKQFIRDCFVIHTGKRLANQDDADPKQRGEVFVWTKQMAQARVPDQQAVLAAIEGIPAKVVAALPPGGGGSGVTPAQVEEACRAAIDSELGFLKPGQ
jgi:hypothetical protein